MLIQGYGKLQNHGCPWNHFGRAFCYCVEAPDLMSLGGYEDVLISVSSVSGWRVDLECQLTEYTLELVRVPCHSIDHNYGQEIFWLKDVVSCLCHTSCPPPPPHSSYTHPFLTLLPLPPPYIPQYPP